MTRNPRTKMVNLRAERTDLAVKTAQAPRSYDSKAKHKATKKPPENDPMSRYLNDLVKNAPPLLTQAQEISLGRLLEDHILIAAEALARDVGAARAILKLEHASERSKRAANEFVNELNPDGLRGRALLNHLFKMLRSSDGPEWFQRYAEADGKALAERFVTSNLRLVVSLAKKYGRGILPMEELVQEGNTGLMRSVQSFDYRRGFRFSTYAAWWVRHAISRAMADKSRTVRMPVHLIEFYSRVGTMRLRLTGELARPPDDEEIAEAILKTGEGKPFKPRFGSHEDRRMALIDKIRTLATRTRMPSSIDQPVLTDDGSELTLHEVLKAEAKETHIWDSIVEGASIDKLHRALARLRPIELDVLRKRFGFGDDVQLTFEEIGVRYGLSRERIRQIQNEALKRLKSDNELAPLLREMRG